MTSDTEKLKPSDVLDHAATLIDYWGLHRGSYLNPATGAMCHLGAIYTAAGYHIHRHSKKDGWVRTTRGVNGFVAEAAADWDRKAIGGSVVIWNDDKCGSKKEAVAKLREAAAMAREAGE